RPLHAGRSLPQELEDAEEVLHVLELLDRLAREEARGLQIRRLVEPVAALDAGHLAVEELVHHPCEQLAVALRLEPGAREIERHLLAREQHVGKVSTARRGGPVHLPTPAEGVPSRTMRRLHEEIRE